MALTDKDIIITPNRGQTSEPKIDFKGASASLGPQTITLNVYPTDNGTLSFEGSAGQLFSITNSLTGTIFSVNDVSGIPSIEVLDTGTIRLAQYSGNVGIGVVTPSTKLDVAGNVRSTGSFVLDNDNALYWGLGDGSTNIKANSTTDAIWISTVGTERMRIDSSGNVGIGVSPAQKLHVAGNIVATGDVTAYYSDERLKTFDGKIANALEKVNAISGYYFYENELAKSLGYDNPKRQVGVSAQEIKQVLPEAVVPAVISDEYLTVKYDRLIPLLIEAIKEQNNKIEYLENFIKEIANNK